MSSESKYHLRVVIFRRVPSARKNLARMLSEFVQVTIVFSRSEECGEVVRDNFEAYFSWGKSTEN